MGGCRVRPTLLGPRGEGHAAVADVLELGTEALPSPVLLFLGLENSWRVGKRRGGGNEETIDTLLTLV